MPLGYMDQEGSDILSARQEQALSLQCGETLGDFPTALLEKRISNSWQSAAVRLYQNWLSYLSAQKERNLSETKPKEAGSRERIRANSRLAAVD